MNKKILSLMLSLTLLLMTFLPINALAVEIEPEEFVIYANEIKNADISIQGNDIITLTTTAPLEEETRSRATVNTTEQINAAAVSTIALIVNNPEDTYDIYNELLAAVNENSNYKSSGDYVAGLRIHSTVYYTTQMVDGSEWYRLIRITGGNNKSNPNSSVIGSGYTISSQYVQFGVAGRNLEGLSPLQSWFSYEEPARAANSFDIDVASQYPNWPTVSESQGLLGATYTVTIHSVRGGNDRVLEIVNNPLDSIDISFN